MLQFLRSSVGSWIVKILFVLLILSFGVWGIGDLFRGRVSNEVAEVGDVSITTAELDQAFRLEMARLRQVLGTVDADQARQLGLLDQALDQLVVRTLYAQEAGDLGLIVPDEIAIRQLQQEPAFRNAQGQFDPGLFRQVLAANNLSEDSYLRSLKSDIARQILLGTVTSGAAAPAPLVEPLYRRLAERRVAETLFLPEAAVPDPGTPDPETLAKFHQDRAVRFTAPEYRALTAAALGVDELARDITVGEEEVRAAFEERADEFRTPEQRDLEQVLVQDEETARAVAEAARRSGNLAEAATAAGAEVLPLPGVTKEDLLPELADAAFTLPSGGISEPLQSPLGWHVLRVGEIRPATEQTFESVRETLAEQLRRERAADRVYEVANQLDDLLAGGATVPEAAEKLGLRLVQVPAVDAAGQGPDGKPVEAVPGIDRLAEQAFRLAKGEVTTLIETPEGGYVVAQVDEVIPARLRPLDEVRDAVVAAWQAEQRAAAAAKRAEEIAAQIKGGTPLQEIAAAIPGAEVGRTEPLTRSGQNGGRTPPLLVEQLFEVKPGEVATAPVQGGQMIARLAEIQVPDPAANEAEVARLRQSVEQAIAGDLLAQFSNALRREHEVEINRGVIDTMYTQD